MNDQTQCVFVDPVLNLRCSLDDGHDEQHQYRPEGMDGAIGLWPAEEAS